LHETILVLDFGSQYTQLIARRVREAGVYCEILPFNVPYERIAEIAPKGLILSGSPASVYSKDAPRPDSNLLKKFDKPLLGICYGFQVLAADLGGHVEASDLREYGYARLKITDNESQLFADLPKELDVWMSHGDHVTEPPKGFRVTALSENILNGMEDSSRNLFGVQFHPEVAHTPLGAQVLRNFLRICGCKGDWSPKAIIAEQVERIRTKAGTGNVICGLSGGVDSTVAAALVHKAIGERQTCIFVDTGLLRAGEFETTLSVFKQYMNLNVRGVNAAQRFLSELRGVTDPEAKRKIIGRVFIEVFDEEARRVGDAKFLVQGTLYPDVIESTSVRGPSAVIKSHHNVGGLPEKMNLKLIEPLRELFKDEVRLLGRELEVPEEILERHPFPGPGMAVRILGEVTEERVRLLQSADMIVQEELRLSNLYNSVWQAFAVLLPVSTVGVMGDDRTYEKVLAVRAVTSIDGMTADWARLPHDLLARISNRIVSEVKGINRVVYDISSKPPSTIEWE
jgi:GMP synthase (glutamine-hydrolysing)